MSDLDQAISIATKAHAGQLDKAGQPYILHPLRLMLKFQAEDEMIVAALHDVVEDSSFTLKSLRKYEFSEVVINAVASLTKGKGESYEDFVLRVSNNDLARKVKFEANSSLLNVYFAFFVFLYQLSASSGKSHVIGARKKIIIFP